MPLTDLQQRVLRLLAANRSPESYVAGSTVIHRAQGSPRFSQDLDFFHDAEDSVAQSAEADAELLAREGFGVEWGLRTPLFHRAVVTVSGESVRLEWGQDTAFRFFPVEPDDLCGYRLHVADAAVNKALALAGRQEARDFVDVLHLDAAYLSLGALAWAACGKDPGFTPDFLLDQLNRHACYTQVDVDRLALARPLDVRELKKQWLTSLDAARQLVSALPPEEVGCLYLDPNGRPTTPDPSMGPREPLTRHVGSVRGAWPRVS